MKKLILIGAVFLGFAFNAAAQTSSTAEFSFKEEKHDFGNIPVGTPVTTKFEFTNVGQQPLIITDVKPTCGCTVADFPKLPIKQGEKGVITITFNAAVVQPFNKTIIVTSNAKTPTKYLNIVGEVVAKTTSGGR